MCIQKVEFQEALLSPPHHQPSNFWSPAELGITQAPVIPRAETLGYSANQGSDAYHKGPTRTEPQPQMKLYKNTGQKVTKCYKTKPQTLQGRQENTKMQLSNQGVQRPATRRKHASSRRRPCDSK
jgi:hypothetical protein